MVHHGQHVQRTESAITIDVVETPTAPCLHEQHKIDGIDHSISVKIGFRQLWAGLCVLGSVDTVPDLMKTTPGW